MASSKNNDSLTFREITYTIQLKDKDSGFHEVYDLLRSELTRFEASRKKSDLTENPIRDFLKINIERSIVIRENTRVYFIDYQEKGSFSISFTLLLITQYINYGTVRRALDYLLKDTIGDYFEELIERHMPVSITIESADNELYQIPGSNLEYKSEHQPAQRDWLPLFIASIALLIAISIGMIGFYRMSNPPDQNKTSNDYRDKYFELLIEKNIQQALAKEKTDFLFQNRINSLQDTVKGTIFH